MAETSLSLDELTRKLMGVEDADVLRETLSRFVRELMGGGVSQPCRNFLRVAHEMRPEEVTRDERDDHRRRK